jgi:hypothetical protein
VKEVKALLKIIPIRRKEDRNRTEYRSVSKSHSLLHAFMTHNWETPHLYPGDKMKKCNAKNRQGTPCSIPPSKNGRCRFHGGKSTGPRTEEGKMKSSQNASKHGMYSKKERESNTEVEELCEEVMKILRQLS